MNHMETGRDRQVMALTIVVSSRDNVASPDNVTQIWRLLKLRTKKLGYSRILANKDSSKEHNPATTKEKSKGDSKVKTQNIV